jgi:hypothetical protein
MEGEYWHPGRDVKFIITDFDDNGVKDIIGCSGNNDLDMIGAIFRLNGNNLSGEAPPDYGDFPSGSQLWYAVNPNSGFCKKLELADITGDGIPEIKYTDQNDNVWYVNSDGCAPPSITPTSRSHSSKAEIGNVTVSVATAECKWSANSNNPDWMNITSGSNGIGDGTVTYFVKENSSTQSRIGTLAIAGRIFTISQDAPPQYKLTVNKAGNGNGSVTGQGINCGSDCSEEYIENTQVTLTATPNTGSTFVGWSGACSGTTTTCQVTMNQAQNVVAVWNTGIPIAAGSKGQAIIVAAGDTQRQNRALNRYTQDFTERMYRLLSKRGFQDDDIHLINMWPQDIDMDGHPDTQRQDYNLFDPEQNFTDAFAQAAARIVSGQQFIFYIHGHARENHYIITSDYELSATRLRDLLATLPAGVQQIIILDSCYSGSFLDELAGVPDRIVISSADATSLAWNTKYASFSEKFIHNLRLQDQSVLDAFYAAEGMIKSDPKLFGEQTPWLDDDGDGQYTSQDGRLAAKINLGCLAAQECASAAPPPAIVHVHEPLSFENRQLTLWVKTSPGKDAIHQVRAVFVNPEFVSQNYEGEATDFEREQLELLYNPAGERYEVFYDDFWTGGLWRIMYQAQNKEGVWSEFVTGEVHSNINCNPCVKMTRNQSRYNAASGDEVRIDMLINGQSALVDLYVALVFPGGYWITIAHPFTISMPNSIQVYQPNVEINEQRRLSIMDFPLPTDVAKGNYKACGVLVGAGNDPHPPENWLHIHCADFEVY